MSQRGGPLNPHLLGLRRPHCPPAPAGLSAGAREWLPLGSPLFLTGYSAFLVWVHPLFRSGAQPGLRALEFRPRYRREKNNKAPGVPRIEAFGRQLASQRARLPSLLIVSALCEKVGKNLEIFLLPFLQPSFRLQTPPRIFQIGHKYCERPFAPGRQGPPMPPLPATTKELSMASEDPIPWNRPRGILGDPPSPWTANCPSGPPLEPPRRAAHPAALLLYLGHTSA